MRRARDSSAALIVMIAASSMAACTILFDDVRTLTGGRAPTSLDGANEKTVPADGGMAGIETDGAVETDGASIDSPYVAAVRADQPVAFFRLEPTTDGLVADEMGGAAAKLFGATVAAGVGGGTGVELDGETAYLDLGSRFAVAGTTPVTFELWVEPQKVDTGYRRLLSTEEGQAATRQGWALSLHAQYGLYVERFLDGASDKVVVGSDLLAAGSMHHVAIAYDGAELRVHIDGVLHGRGDATRALKQTGKPVVIGKHASSPTPSQAGIYDEVAIYATALSAARIRAHYDAAWQ